VLREVSDRITRRNRKAAVKHEADLERISPGERRITGTSVEDIPTDEFAEERLGAQPDRLLGQDGLPRS
jgi:hypothetical protein